MLCACVRRLSLLEQLLRGRLEARKLQKHLREAFPAAAVEEHLREYADKAWAALGDTSLQVGWKFRDLGRTLAGPWQAGVQDRVLYT